MLDSSPLQLHTVAAYYPDHPTDEEKRAAKGLVEALRLLYPCSHCRAQLAVDLEKLPVDDALASRESFSLWMCKQHNFVNASLGTCKTGLATPSRTVMSVLCSNRDAQLGFEYNLLVTLVLNTPLSTVLSRPHYLFSLHPAGKPEQPCSIDALDERWRRGRAECWLPPGADASSAAAAAAAAAATTAEESMGRSSHEEEDAERQEASSPALA